MSGRAGHRERAELIAAAAVAEALDAKLIPRDHSGAQQTRDFDLVFSGGRDHEPLEVTTFASQPDLETWQRLDHIDEEISAPELSQNWYLDVGPPITGHRTQTLDVRQLAREVVAILAALEAGGYQSIEYGLIDRDPAVTTGLRRLLALGVDAGNARPRAEGEPARVVFVAPVGGFVHADLVAWGIEQEADKTDNRNKLREPPAALRRHLAVIFDGSSGAAFTAAHQGLTGRLPRLPPPITTAWALASESLLGATPPSAWVHRRIPQQVFDSPEAWLA